MDGKIADIENARATAYGALAEQLKKPRAAQLQLQAEAGKLSTALRSTLVRWQLGRTAGRAGRGNGRHASLLRF